MNSIFEFVVKASSPTRNQIGYTPPPPKGGWCNRCYRDTKRNGGLGVQAFSLNHAPLSARGRAVSQRAAGWRRGTSITEIKSVRNPSVSADHRRSQLFTSPWRPAVAHIPQNTLTLPRPSALYRDPPQKIFTKKGNAMESKETAQKNLDRLQTELEALITAKEQLSSSAALAHLDGGSIKSNARELADLKAEIEIKRSAVSVASSLVEQMAAQELEEMAIKARDEICEMTDSLLVVAAKFGRTMSKAGKEYCEMVSLVEACRDKSANARDWPEWVFGNTKAHDWPYTYFTNLASLHLSLGPKFHLEHWPSQVKAMEGAEISKAFSSLIHATDQWRDPQAQVEETEDAA